VSWLFGVGAAVLVGLASLGKIEILKSFAMKHVFWNAKRLRYLQFAVVGVFVVCLWPAFLILPTLGRVHPNNYFTVYTIGYLMWISLNQVVIAGFVFLMGKKAKTLLETCRKLGARREENQIKRLILAVKVLIFLMIIAIALWIAAWYAPDSNPGVAMTVFLISCSLANSGILIVTMMFKVMKYHAKQTKDNLANPYKLGTTSETTNQSHKVTHSAPLCPTLIERSN
jgi:hypothetical protein